MHEQTLRDFFLGTATATELASDLVGAMKRRANEPRHLVVDMHETFELRVEHLVRVSAK